MDSPVITSSGTTTCREVDLEALQKIEADLQFWKSHAEESDTELCQILDALGLKQDPPGVTALDRIRDMIARIGCLQDQRDEALARLRAAEARLLEIDPGWRVTPPPPAPKDATEDSARTKS